MTYHVYVYLELPVSIFSAWAEISAFAGYSARGCFFHLKGFWPGCLISYVVMWCHAVNSFTSSGLNWHYFSDWTFSAPQKTQLVVLGNQWYGVSRLIRTNSRPFHANSRLRFFQQNVIFCPSCVFLQCKLHHVAGCISHTLQPFDPLNLQHVFMFAT